MKTHVDTLRRLGKRFRELDERPLLKRVRENPDDQKALEEFESAVDEKNMISLQMADAHDAAIPSQELETFFTKVEDACFEIYVEWKKMRDRWDSLNDEDCKQFLDLWKSKSLETSDRELDSVLCFQTFRSGSPYKRVCIMMTAVIECGKRASKIAERRYGLAALRLPDHVIIFD